MINQEAAMRTLIALLIACAVAAAQGHVSVERRPAPEKALVFEVTIPADRSAVWRAFTTRDGLKTWVAPDALVELRSGGEWTALFPGGKTGGGTIVSFVPQQELVIAALAPEQFPNVRSQRTTAKFELIAEGRSTLVRLTQTGWKDGEE